MLTDLHKNLIPFAGERGLPEHYPVPNQSEDLLFYIQRNLNLNTVVYQLNTVPGGSINQHFPMQVQWIKYSENGQITDLNYIQNQLAYGYQSEMINSDTFKFHMVSRKERIFFITKLNDKHQVITKINGQDSVLSNIYVYADDVGLFPEVRYIEFYGAELKTNFPSYEKVKI